MKKKIAHWLRALAQKLDRVERYEEVDNYVGRDCASAYSISKKDIKEYEKSHSCSMRVAMRCLIKECMERNRRRILNTLTANKIFFEKVYKQDGNTIVETRLKLLIREKKDTSTNSCKKD